MGIASIVHPWCQKVLPLTYDESLSYYEVLCKLRAKINECVDAINGYDEVISELKDALGDLTSMKLAISELQSQVSTIDNILGNLDAEDKY